MASFKSMIVLAVLSLSMMSFNPVMGQRRTTADFWIQFAELLTTDVLTRLATIQLPALPQFPTFPQIPNIQIPSIPIPNIPWPDTPIIHSHAPDYAPHIHINPASPQSLPWPFPVPPTIPTLPPVTTARPVECDGCKPERVRIVVVDDCDKEKSSESCEDSDEVDIIVPYTNRGRYQHKKRTN